MDVEAQKRAAALAACRLVRSSMVLGYGTGSTVQFALEELARRHRAGESFTGVPTSRRTEEACRVLGLPTAPLQELPALDLTIDGADEIDPRLHLIKGGGGALLREKVVAAASRSVVIIAEGKKLVERLGTTFAVPVEVVPFAVPSVERRLATLGARPTRRRAGSVEFVTDNGNLILDARFAGIDDPESLEQAIKMTPGVAEVGLFCGLATRAFVGTGEGVRELTPPRPDKRL